MRSASIERLSHGDAARPEAQLALERYVSLHAPELRYGSIGRDERALQAFAHAGDVEEHVAVGSLHHEEEEVAALVGRHLHDVQRLVVPKSALARFEQLLGSEARDATRVGDIRGEPAFAAVALEPAGDMAQARGVEYGCVGNPARRRRGERRRRQEANQAEKDRTSAPHRPPFLALESTPSNLFRGV